jgi:hypothetical protein
LYKQIKSKKLPEKKELLEEFDALRKIKLDTNEQVQNESFDNEAE